LGFGSQPVGADAERDSASRSGFVNAELRHNVQTRFGSQTALRHPKGLRQPKVGASAPTLGHRPTNHQPQRGCGNSGFDWRSC